MDDTLEVFPMDKMSMHSSEWAIKMYESSQITEITTWQEVYIKLCMHCTVAYPGGVL